MPTGPAEPNDVRLVEITRENLMDVIRLEVAPSQRRFVASNAVSIAQAHFHEQAWMRAIAAGEELVGFVLLSEDPSQSEYCVWRFMIDARHQGRGFGRAAMARVVERVRALPGASQLLLSYVPGEDGPAAFYAALGFAPTGEVDDGEIVCALDL